MPPKHMISNYAQHLNLLEQEQKLRLFNVPPFYVILGLAAFTHIALIAPILFVKVADSLPKTKQVRLAFGIDSEINKETPQPQQTSVAQQDKPQSSSPKNELVQTKTPIPKTPVIKTPVLETPVIKASEQKPTIRQNNTENNSTSHVINPSTPSTPTYKTNVMVRPERAQLANLRQQGGGYKSDIAAKGEIVGKYEQLLSGWINRHRLNKMLTLPANASGRVVVRLRINRRGYVIFKAIEQSSGDANLDNAAIESVTRASPVPAVPQQYPGGAQLEFLIPISFVVN